MDIHDPIVALVPPLMSGRVLAIVGGFPLAMGITAWRTMRKRRP